MRAVDSTMPPSAGSAPPARPVPAPRAVTGTPRSAASRSSDATCSVVSGRTTTSGGCFSSVKPSTS
jgi:hypothetical protein